ncbi:unnamed protein product [Owenia fusiformis]|uniref:Uncharacterized protein n=1 Tax=Owenia fusiformis TaxID=6347 RepID=A0A8J1XVF1_OWEFU|nr:unnamed protein product [Owenia fusiformis]
MASASSKKALTDDYKNLLTCIICFETLKTPKSLSCGHSFCKSCINNWIGQHRHSHDQRFPCPICNQRLEIPENGADEYHTNITINSIVESLEKQLSLEENVQVNCDICIQDGDNIQAISRCFECAENLCQSCEKTHKRFRAFKSHTLCELTGDLEQDTRIALENFYKRNIDCSKHPDEPLRFYCKNDKSVVCRDCCITNHSGHKCVDIEEAVNAEKPNISALLGLANQRKEILEQHIQLSVDSLHEYEGKTKTLLAQIDADHAMKLKQMKKHFNKLRNEVITSTNEQTKKQQAKQDQLELERGITDSTIVHLTSICKHGHPVDILNSSNDINKKLETWAVIPDRNPEPLDTYKYKPGILDMSNTGQVTKQGQVAKQVEVTKQIIPCNPKITSKVHLSDKNGVCGKIYGVTLGHNGDIVVCHNNNIIASYNAVTLIKKHAAAGNFNDVCCIQDNCYAATDYTNKCVAIYSQNLQHQRNIGKFGNPIGICSTQSGELLVVDNTAECVNLIDSNNGAVLATIGKGKLIMPWFVTMNSEGVVIVSNLRSCVTGFTIEDEIAIKYGTYGSGDGQLSQSYNGVCTDADGNIIIADNCNNRVQLLDRKGKFIKYLLKPKDGVVYPRKAAINQHGALIVASYHGEIVEIKYMK